MGLDAFQPESENTPVEAPSAVGASTLVALMLALVAVVATTAWSPASAQAARDGDVATIKLVLANPSNGESGDAEYERTKSEEITKMASSRLRSRLETALIKKFSIESDTPGTIVVEARGGVSRGLLAGIVVPQGRFELRPTKPVGTLWTKMSSELPEGIEIRQEKGSLAVEDAFLWSRSKKKLREVIADVDLASADIGLYPMGAGWRTVALDKVVATHRDVSNASIRQGNTGETYVEVQFNQRVSASHLPKRRMRTWAAVLDGEIVSRFERLDSDFGTSLTISAPEHLGSAKLRRAWAQQVAGRLAAFMSVPFVEMPEDLQ